jgi:hypothetical protein
MDPKESSPQPQGPSPNLYGSGNDAVRVDSYNELDDTISVAMRSFFRQLGSPHLFEERVLPTLRAPEAVVFAAVRDRPWPPWGHGSRRIVSLVQAHSIGQRSYGLGPLYVRPEETSNIGLRAALYKELLESLSRHAKAEVNYLVVERSVLTARILEQAGFVRSEDVVVTEEARYAFYRTDANALLQNLGLQEVSVPELLTHEADWKVLERNALFQAVLEWGRSREVIPIDGGSFDASLPGGGGSPTPPSRMPEIGPIDVVTQGP